MAKTNIQLCEKLEDRGYHLYVQRRERLNRQISNNGRYVDEKKYLNLTVKEVERLAANQDVDAQFTMGLFYLNQNQPSLAYEYFKKAADQNAGLAMELLGTMYHSGTGVERNLAEAEKWYLKAVHTNCSYDAMISLIEIYSSNPTYDHIKDSIDFAVLVNDYCVANSADDKAKILKEEILRNIRLLLLIHREMENEGAILIDYSENEDIATEGYYWRVLAEKSGVQSEPSKIGEVSEYLFYIAENAAKLNKPYAESVLQEAYQQGSAYAAVKYAPDLIQKALSQFKPDSGSIVLTGQVGFSVPSISPKQEGIAESYVKELLPLLLKASQDSSIPKYQAEALHYLSILYLTGLGCKENIRQAHDCCEKAAKMGNNPASQMLPHFSKKFLGKWEYI